MDPVASTDPREPFEHIGGPVGVLLCHGFTGSPATLRPWADYLVEQGLTVSVPRLPGHGTTWQDMAKTGWTDWYAEVDRALGALSSQCEQIFLAGLSMGACLALRLAESHGAEVRGTPIRGLVLVNPSLAPDTKLFLLAPVLKHLIRSLPGIASDIKKPGVDELGYHRVPVKAAATMPGLWRATAARLSDIRQPVLVYRSTVDHVVGPASMPVLTKALPQSQLTVVPLPDSYHVATLDNDARTIFEGSAEFIKEHAALSDIAMNPSLPVSSLGYSPGRLSLS
jgi:carboxylesterase